MYNIAKHIIHLNESSTAAYLTACEMSEAHRQLMSRTERANHIRAMEGVQQSIQHKLTLLEGCKVRVESLDKRTQNMTNLVSITYPRSDHLVINALAGFQHRQPTRQPHHEVGQPINESNRHRDHAFPPRSDYRSKLLLNLSDPIQLDPIC